MCVISAVTPDLATEHFGTEESSATRRDVHKIRPSHRDEHRTPAIRVFDLEAYALSNRSLAFHRALTMKSQRVVARLSAALLFIDLASAQFNTATINNASSTACPSRSGAHIIVARGSTVRPQPGYGAIGAIKDKVLQEVPGSTAEFVNYPATLGDYINSERDGVLAMRRSINDYIARCSASSPLVIMGYSQGAQVTADGLIGQNVTGFPTNASISQPLPATTLSRIAAVILMGDPSFVPTETFHVGNATKAGIFPRRDVANFDLSGLASRTRSYCDFDDPYCASGNFSTGLRVHLGYIQEYGAQVVDFVVAQSQTFQANGTSTSGGRASTETSSTSAGPATYTGAASKFGGQLTIVLAALVVGILAWAL